MNSLRGVVVKVILSLSPYQEREYNITLNNSLLCPHSSPFCPLSIIIFTFCNNTKVLLFGMATDRLTCSSHARVQDNPPAPMSRMFSNARYVSILAISSSRERAKRADPCHTNGFLRTINPPSLAHVAKV